MAELVAHQTSEAKVPSSNPASPTMVLKRLQDRCDKAEHLRVERETDPWGKKNFKNKNDYMQQKVLLGRGLCILYSGLIEYKPLVYGVP